MSWNSLIPTAGQQQTLQRANSVLGKKTVYKLGEGGFDPSKPFTPECDCSGFVAWAIGIPRELPPGSNKWLSTDEYWKGGAPTLPGFCTEVAMKDALHGDLLVYPDHGGHQGHICIVVDVANGLPTHIIHCSLGNYTHYGDAVRITDPSVFLSSSQPVKAMRIDYDQLKQAFPMHATGTGQTASH